MVVKLKRHTVDNVMSTVQGTVDGVPEKFTTTYAFGKFSIHHSKYGWIYTWFWE